MQESAYHGQHCVIYLKFGKRVVLMLNVLNTHRGHKNRMKQWQWEEIMVLMVSKLCPRWCHDCVLDGVTTISLMVSQLCPRWCHDCILDGITVVSSMVSRLCPRWYHSCVLDGVMTVSLSTSSLSCIHHMCTAFYISIISQ